MEESKFPLPNVFIVGAPKAGTTTINSILAQHPAFYMSDIKEPGFFCTDLIEESDAFHGRGDKFFKFRTKDQYLSLFSASEDHVYRGEASSKYLFSKAAANNIHAFNPSAKIIILIREPIDFLRSYHAQCLIDLVENDASFASAIGKEDERRAGNSIPRTCVVPSYLLYTELATFSHQIKRYLDAFPKENVKVLLYDDLREKENALLVELEFFLSLKAGSLAPVGVQNKGRSIQYPSLYTSMKRLSKSNVVQQWTKRIPKAQKRAIAKAFLGVNFGPKSHEPMSDELLARLRQHFNPEVTALSELLGKDLHQRWGY
ncbi:MAG: sulfotransferase [Cryomorphaceae bacterium]